MKYVLSLVVLVCIGWHSGYGQAKYEKYFSRYEILHMSDSSVLKINTGSCGATFYDMNGMERMIWLSGNLERFCVRDKFLRKRNLSCRGVAGCI